MKQEMSTNDAWGQLKELLNLAVKEPSIQKDLLVDLLTKKELTDLAQRWVIIKSLHLGVPQHYIAEQLGVGVATVTRGASMLKNPNGGFNKALKVYDKQRNKNK